jgi:hypothetical protein
MHFSFKTLLFVGTILVSAAHAQVDEENPDIKEQEEYVEVAKEQSNALYFRSIFSLRQGAQGKAPRYLEENPIQPVALDKLKTEVAIRRLYHWSNTLMRTFVSKADFIEKQLKAMESSVDEEGQKKALESLLEEFYGVILNNLQ